MSSIDRIRFLTTGRQFGMKKNKKVSLSKKPFLVLSRRAIAGWLGVIFILCAWMFVVGIMVGRGTAPVKFKINGLQSKLKIPGQKGNPDQNGQDQDESGLVEDKTQFDFYEALPEDRQDFKMDKKKQAPIFSKKVGPAPAEKPPPTSGEKATPKIEPQKQTDPKTDFKKKKPAKQPVVTKNSTQATGNIYTIQVAAFKAKNENDANSLVAKLKSKGYDAYRKIIKIKDKGIWIRVRVGKYTTKAAASSTLNRLEKSEPKLKPIVVSYK
jgi:cell division septation protein DedD